MKMINRKGFTLLEILMVIVIIAILAALAIPQYLKIAKKGHASEAVSNIGDIKGAMMRYYAEYGEPTTNISDLDITDPGTLDGAKFSYTINSFTDEETYKITASGKPTASAVTDVCVYLNTTTDTSIHVDVDGSSGQCGN